MFFNNYDLEKMVPEDHKFRKFKERLLVEGIGDDREEMKKCLGREGYGNEAGLRALFLQFYGDHSDREMEEQLRFNFLYRWFCGFTMESQTPDHSFFCRVRKNIGAKRVSEMFTKMVDDAVNRKIIKKLESFVDASAIRRKEAEWAKRDREKEEEQKPAGNKPAAKKFSGDKEAKWGCKGHKKYWFGYKRHVSVDTSSGLIEKIAVTPANVNDSSAFPLVCPWDKKILADRGYDTWLVRGTMKKKGCIDGVLRLTKRKDFDKRRNKKLSRKRSPWERVFSKMSKRTRYMGVHMTWLQALFEGMVHNLKRLIVLEGVDPPIIGLA